ncbi:MAG: hypothetical protein ACRESO_04105, partial [Gammaproteobacteria bacterium]
MSTTAFYESFGSGVLIAKGLTTNQPGITFGALQDVTLEVSGTTKSLFGSGQFPIASARGETKITGKAKMGQVSGPLYNSLYFGGTTAIGTTAVAYGESHPIPTTPYTVTVTNSATFVEDLGVVYSATGVPLTPVTSSPTTGQYSVAAGVYTFAAADTTLSVNISYSYTSASSGSTLTLGNPLQGVQPVFECIIARGYNNTG